MPEPYTAPLASVGVHTVCTDCLRRLFFPLFASPRVWQSSRYRAFTSVIDRFSFWFTLINNCLVVGNHARFRLMRWSLILNYGLVAFWVTCAIAQQYWCRRSPDTYFKHRYLMLLLNRVSRLLAAAAWLRHVRLVTEPPPRTAASPVLLLATARPGLPTSYAAFSFAMLVTGAFPSVMHAINTPMPLLGQTVMQVGYLSVLLVQHASTAVALLDASPFKPQYAAFCSHLNNLLYLVASLCGHVADHRMLRSECSRNATWLLVLFTVLYFGAVVPLYVSYWLERYFWHVMHGHEGEAAGQGHRVDTVVARVLKANIVGLTQLAWHAALLAYAAALTWVLVVAVHPKLGRLLLRGGARGPQAELGGVDEIAFGAIGGDGW